jgi:thiol-disulfide isomerase/thioredoxin
MVRGIWWSVLVMLASASGLMVAGCDSGARGSRGGVGQSPHLSVENSDPGDPPGPQTEPLLIEDAEHAPLDVIVSVVDRPGLDKLVAEHKGNVVLVDYWATWCPACRKKFPQTVALANRYKTDGLSVISVAMDDEDAHADVVKFLSEQRANFTNVRCQQGSEGFEAFEIPGETLPCMRIFGRSGELLKTFAIDPDADKQFTHEEVAEAVRAALAAE